METDEGACKPHTQGHMRLFFTFMEERIYLLAVMQGPTQEIRTRPPSVNLVNPAHPPQSHKRMHARTHTRTHTPLPYTPYQCTPPYTTTPDVLQFHIISASKFQRRVIASLSSPTQAVRLHMVSLSICFDTIENMQYVSVSLFV